MHLWDEMGEHLDLRDRVLAAIFWQLARDAQIIDRHGELQDPTIAAADNSPAQKERLLVLQSMLNSLGRRPAPPYSPPAPAFFQP